MSPRPFRPNPDRWQKSHETKRWTLEISRFLNTQCVSAGVTINWNFRPSLEVDLLLWRVYIEFKINKSRP